MIDDELTPLQEETLAMLRRSEPVIFDPAFVADLISDVNRACVDFNERLTTEAFFNKTRVGNVLGCEVAYLTPSGFAWNPMLATGQISHRAIQVGLNVPTQQLIPEQLVDGVIESLPSDDPDASLSGWLRQITTVDRADLRSLAVDKVTKFFESFPPLRGAYWARTESSTRWDGGKIKLVGKADLVIGKPRQREAVQVIIDLKTGRRYDKHADELRFYALIETLRSGLPPRKLATFYLDEGRAVAEDVTEQVLRSAARRTLDAVHAHIELTEEDREAAYRPSYSCTWCAVLPDCDVGRTFLADLSEPDH